MDFTIQIEELDDVQDEIARLAIPHHAEVEMDRDEVPHCPNWASYRALEANGMFFVMTMRDRLSHDLLGYVSAITSESLHTSARTGYVDAIYMAPEHRKGLLAMNLLRAMETELRLRDCKKMYIAHKSTKDLSKLFTFMGFKPDEITFSKVLGGNHG